MSTEREFLITELDRDRISRTTRIKLGLKSITTPTFAPLVHSSSDLDALIQIQSVTGSDYVRCFITRLFDAQNVLPAAGKGFQMDMLGRLIANRIDLFLEQTVFALDPGLEYLYYDTKMDRFLSNEATPEIIADYVKSLVSFKKNLDSRQYNRTKIRAHREFWETISNDPLKRNKLVRRIFQYATKLRADFLIPPVPLMLDNTFFGTTAKMNDISRELALALGRKECANYFLLPARSLQDPSLIGQIKDYILDSPSRLNIFKFKYLNLTPPDRVEERENYKDLLLELAYFSRTFKNRCFAVLENYYQSFPSAVVGFDIVSGSITGFDGDGGRAEKPSFGKWIDPRLMVPLEFKGVQSVFRNNGGRLPCHHSFCRTVTNIEQIPQPRWNVLRRQHCSMYYGDLMTQIARAIRERNVEFARNKLSDSQLSTLRNLIPPPEQMS